jgi:hypothetical protein
VTGRRGRSCKHLLDALNPSFADWAQHATRRAFFLNSSRRYRVTILPNFLFFHLIPLKQHNHHSEHVLFLCVVCFLSNPTGLNCTDVSKKMPQIRVLSKLIT